MLPDHRLHDIETVARVVHRAGHQTDTLELVAELRRVRMEIHLLHTSDHRHTVTGEDISTCTHCEQPYPCPTVAALGDK